MPGSSRRAASAHRSGTHTAVRHAVAQSPLGRLAVAFDALRAAATAARRVAGHRGDTALAEQVDQLVDRAAQDLQRRAVDARTLRTPPTRGHAQ